MAEANVGKGSEEGVSAPLRIQAPKTQSKDGMWGVFREKPKRFTGLLLALVMALGAIVYSALPDTVLSTKTQFEIGLIAPMTGPDAALGEVMRNGAQIYLDEINRSGVLGDVVLGLDIKDTFSSQEMVPQLARELVTDDDVVAILGPLDEAQAMLAGEFYRESGPVAVTGTDGSTSVTIGNPWLFRTGLSTDLQGKMLANYLARVLEEQRIIIIQEDGWYGESLSIALNNELSLLKRMGTSSIEITMLPPLTLDPEQQGIAITELTRTLAETYANELLVLAVTANTAKPLIRALRDNPRRRFGRPLEYRMIGSASLSHPSLVEHFSQLRREQAQPGLYTENMMVVAPFMRDISTQAALGFRERYRQTFNTEPSALAAGFRDATATIVQALKQVDSLATRQSDTRGVRQDLRAQMAGFDGPDKAVDGVMGALYFDPDGNALAAAPIGVYDSGEIVSPAIQMMATVNRESIDPDSIIQVQGRYFSLASMVHTGVELHEIKNIDSIERQADVDFHVWFRYRGTLDISGIEFVNAVGPVTIGPPEEQEQVDGVTYQLHHVSGTFRMGFLPSGLSFGQTVIGLQMRHVNLDRSRLILVPDVAAMAVQDDSVFEAQAVQRRIIAGDLDQWTVNRVDIFQDTQPIAIRGNPRFDTGPGDGFSRLNIAFVVEPLTLTLRGMVSDQIAKDMLGLSAVGLILVLLIGLRYRKNPGMSKLIWFPQAFLVMAVIICAEQVIVNWMNLQQMADSQIELVIQVFRVLWWIIPAMLINIAMETFIWRNLELRSGRTVPNVVRKFFSVIVYILATMGVTAFVFDQKITSLLATSGVLAMIIGLAIQMNLANIFSGIAINIEKPFRIGDWIKVGDYEPGRVISMTWRTTRIETMDRNIICIPNSMASDSTLENYSYPGESYRSQIEVHVDPGAQPQWVEKILMDAVLTSQGVLPDPPVEVLFDGVKQWSGEYHIRYFCPDYPASIALDAVIWRNIIRNLRYAGFESVIHEEFTLFHLRDDVKNNRADMFSLIIDDIEVFEPFGRKEKDRITTLIRHRKFLPDSVVVHQGDEGSSLFVVASGVLKVEITLADGTVLEVGRLGVGDFFGEMALLTGEPRAATVTAVSSTLVLELKQSHLEPIIKEYPGLMEDLSEILTRRTLENMRKQKAHARDGEEEDERSLAGRFLVRMSSFFDIPDDTNTRQSA